MSDKSEKWTAKAKAPKEDPPAREVPEEKQDAPAVRKRAPIYKHD